MFRNRILILTLSDIIFINKSTYAVFRKQYEEVEGKCKNRLERYNDNYGALYTLALCNYYKKDLVSCFNLYFKLLEVHRVKYKIQRWFVKQLIEHQLYVRKLYDLTIERCDKLLDKAKNKKIEIMLLKYSCVANFQVGHFDKVLDICLELEKRDYKDEYTDDYKIKASNQIAK